MNLYLEDGSVAGSASVRQVGDDLLFSVSARLSAGLWRIVAHGSGGALALGVMEGGGVWQRRFSSRLAGGLGEVDRLTASRCAPARMESEWQGCRGDEAPGLPPGSLCRRHGGGCTLALPWREDGPFPWPERFCLARTGVMAGRLWVFYALDQTGEAVLSEEN
ncbi:MAG: hypothetical protein IJB04_02835 [Oscillospiraceae bacterium]|nr:hypothetical protein [Oscillospiraceae bacterium]